MRCEVYSFGKRQYMLFIIINKIVTFDLGKPRSFLVEGDDLAQYTSKYLVLHQNV